MENRERDAVSRNNSGPTEGGQVNRETEERIGQEKNPGSTEFGQKIGRAEDPAHEPDRTGKSEGRH
ncbi:MAG TPA: hypothetical protein VF698_19460 [Thermoanaerobaculia bacterium]|jgi:hypothetical protein